MKLVKKLMESLREYKKASILTPIFVTVEVIMEVLIPFVMASLIDKGIEAGSMSVIWKYGILLLVLAMISLAFGTLAGHQASIASCGLSQNLRKDMYYRIQNFSFSNIDKFSTASIVTRLTTDVTNVQNAYQMIIRIAGFCVGYVLYDQCENFTDLLSYRSGTWICTDLVSTARSSVF